MPTTKKIIITGGIIVVWVGGAFLAYKAGDFIGKVIGKSCLAATEKLLTL